MLSNLCRQCKARRGNVNSIARTFTQTPVTRANNLQNIYKPSQLNLNEQFEDVSPRRAGKRTRPESKRSTIVTVDGHTEDSFAKLYTEKVQQGDLQSDELIRTATQLVEAGSPSSGLVWRVALTHYLKVGNAEVFRHHYSRMMKSKGALPLTKVPHVYLWRKAIQQFKHREDVLKLLYQHSRVTQLPRVVQKAKCYTAFMLGLLAPGPGGTQWTLAQTLTWHEKILDIGLRPDKSEYENFTVKLFCQCTPLSDFIPALHDHYKKRHIEFGFLIATFEHLCQTDRVRDAIWMFDFLRAQSPQHIIPRLAEDLLHLLLNHSENQDIMTLIQREFPPGRSSLLSERAKTLIGRAFEQLSDQKTFVQEYTDKLDPASKDAIWARWLSRSLYMHEEVLPSLKALKDVGLELGVESTTLYLEKLPTPEAQTNFLREVLIDNVRLMPAGYNVAIRHCTQSGQVELADQLLAYALACKQGEGMSARDIDSMRRAYMTGLASANQQDELEKVHEKFCAASQDSPTTWNALLRIRVSDNRLEQALIGLEQMQKRAIDVEDATAESFRGALLAEAEKKSTSSDEVDPKETIMHIISVLKKCHALGHHVQPETWGRVLETFAAVTDFNALATFTDWLIPEYLDQSILDRTRLPGYNLVANESQSRMERLINTKVIDAVINNGFRVDRPAEALRVLLRWQSQGARIHGQHIKLAVKGHFLMLDKSKLPKPERRAIRASVRPLAHLLRQDDRMKYPSIQTRGKRQAKIKAERDAARLAAKEPSNVDRQL